MPDQIADDVMADRYTRLHKLQQEISGQINRDSIGKSYEVLITDHEGRHDVERSRMNGRTQISGLSMLIPIKHVLEILLV